MKYLVLFLMTFVMISFADDSNGKIFEVECKSRGLFYFNEFDLTGEFIVDVENHFESIGQIQISYRRIGRDAETQFQNLPISGEFSLIEAGTIAKDEIYRFLYIELGQQSDKVEMINILADYPFQDVSKLRLANGLEFRSRCELIHK